MTEQNVSQVLEGYIRGIAEVQDDDVDFSATVDLFDYGYLDSFGIVDLIAMVQEKYGVDMTNTDFYGDDIRSIEAIAGCIQSQVK